MTLAQLVNELPAVEFAGLMGYEGHLLMIEDLADKEAKICASVQQLRDTATLIKDRTQLESPVISASGTGSFRYSCKTDAITEIEAGGGIFSDLLISRGFHEPSFQYALTVLTTVSSRPTPTRVIADAGRKTLCHWSLLDMPELRPVEKYNLKLNVLCAEHAIFEVLPGCPGSVVCSDGQTGAGPAVGERLQLIPAYHDLSTVLHDYFCCD